MEVVLTMVRLRWALTLATLRKSTWQTIGYVLGIVFGIGALVGVGALAWFLGGPVFDMAGHHIPAGWMYGVLHVAVMYGSTFAGFIILFIQLMLVGDGSPWLRAGSRCTAFPTGNCSSACCSAA
mgnify:CR=1 FL=1